jgi:hypothetical protein
MCSAVGYLVLYSQDSEKETRLQFARERDAKDMATVLSLDDIMKNSSVSQVQCTVGSREGQSTEHSVGQRELA